MSIPIGKLTLGEIGTIERLSGQPIAAIADSDAPKGLVLGALVYVNKFREDPTFTWEKAQNLTWEDAHAYLGLGDDDTEDEAPAPLEGTSSEESPTT